MELLTNYAEVKQVPSAGQCFPFCLQFGESGMWGGRRPGLRCTGPGFDLDSPWDVGRSIFLFALWFFSPVQGGDWSRCFIWPVVLELLRKTGNPAAVLCRHLYFSFFSLSLSVLMNGIWAQWEWAREILFYIFKVVPYTPYSNFTNSSMKADKGRVIIRIL